MKALAYVFWHQPAAGTSRDGYERALAEFHQRLRVVPVAGLRSSWTLRVPSLPWLAGGGYEDWYVVDDFAALGLLNAAAVDPAHRPAHDAAADIAGFGAGGVYELLRGAAQPERGEVTWFAKPPGMSYQDLLTQLPATVPSLWQRQMVLGPAPEFRLSQARPAAPGDLVTVRVEPLHASDPR